MSDHEKLDFGALYNATEILREVITFSKKEHSEQLQKFLQDSQIQRFEYCYDLSHKSVRRHLVSISASPSEIKVMTFPEMVRFAYGKEILKSSWENWSIFRHNRNITSHAYNEKQAKEIASCAPQFLDELDYLCNYLRKFYGD